MPKKSILYILWGCFLHILWTLKCVCTTNIPHVTGHSQVQSSFGSSSLIGTRKSLNIQQETQDYSHFSDGDNRRKLSGPLPSRNCCVPHTRCWRRLVSMVNFIDILCVPKTFELNEIYNLSSRGRILPFYHTVLPLQLLLLLLLLIPLLPLY